MTNNYSQEVVKVVGNSSGKSAHRLHLLSLSKLFFQSSFFCNVFGNHFIVLDLIFSVPNNAAAKSDRNCFLVLPFPADFNPIASPVELVGSDGELSILWILVDITLQVKQKQFLFGAIAQH